MIEKATRDEEETVTGTLDDIEPPAVTVVGDVVAVRDEVADTMARGGARAEGAALPSRVPAWLSDVERELASLEGGRGP